jgi:uncharacterized protein
MRAFLLLVLVLIVVWLWRSSRSGSSNGRKTPPGQPQPQAMVACALCGVHLPQADALAGRQGLYCSAEHRQRAEP